MKTMGMAAALVALAAATPALAQTAEPERPEVVRAPKGAFELGVSTGYTQGFGLVSRGFPLSDVAGPGLGLGVDLAYRATPGISVGLAGQFQGFTPSAALARGTTVRGGTLDADAIFHGAPYGRLDPWVSVGAGYRALWQVPAGSAPTVMTHGFELGKVQFGVDLRAGESVAIAPAIGAGLDMFVWQSSSATEEARLRARGLSGFVFAGITGRFDIGGARVAQPVAVAGLQGR